MIQFPEKFQERMQQMLGDEEYAEFLKSYDLPFHNGLRINTWKIKPQELLQRMGVDLKQVPWNETGFYLENKKQFSKHPYYQGGLYYIQEASAMLPAKLVNAQPGEKILDMCAAPGGKSTAIGAALKGEGLLISNDISKSRAKALLRNLEGFGIINSIVVSEYPEKLSRYFPEFFDKVLIDAPCSGEGMFHKEPSMTESWLRMGPEEYHKLQMEILTYGAKMVRPGGKLIYSTCTFSPEENEQTIEFLLQEYPQFKICDIKGYEGFSDGILKASLSGNEQLKKTIRIFPHKMEGEGHFIALLKKEEEAVSENLKEKEKNNRNKNEKEKRLPDELTEFLKNVKRKFDSSRIDMRGENVYYMPEGLPKLNGVRFLRSGLLLGELKKRRFEPSQALAMNLKKEEYENVLDFSVDDERIIKYLKGETLEVEDLVSSKEKGWYLVCVDGYPLGFGKLSGQMLKNKYLPGWRWQSS